MILCFNICFISKVYVVSFFSWHNMEVEMIYFLPGNYSSRLYDIYVFISVNIF